MFIWLYSPDATLWIFRLIVLTGLLCGLTTYYLTARKGKRADSARPIIGFLFGSLMFTSFSFLAFQMTNGRFYAMTLVDDSLKLHMIRGETVRLPEAALTDFQVKYSANGKAYLEYLSPEGDYFRAGPLDDGAVRQLEKAKGL